MRHRFNGGILKLFWANISTVTHRSSRVTKFGGDHIPLKGAMLVLECNKNDFPQYLFYPQCLGISSSGTEVSGIGFKT